MAFDSEELNKRRERREQLRIKREQQQKRTVIGLIAAAVVLAACAVLIVAVAVSRRSAAPDETQPSQSATEQTTTPEQTDSTEPTEQTQPATQPSGDSTVITIAAAGDLNVTDNIVASGGTSFNYVNTFMDVVPLLSDADLTVLNFEGNLCGHPYGTATASAPQTVIDALRAAGVDMLQMANSRAVYNGISGLITTLQNMRTGGITPIGAYASEQEYKNSGGYTICNVQGIKVGIVAFTKGMDGMALPAGSEHCVNLLYTDYSSTYQKVDKDGITKVLRALQREKPDVTIALLHWGSEYNDKESDTQKTIKSLMLSEGVDAIIGTHPHYVQRMEYDEEAGTFVAYSLGDFISDAQRAGTEYSVVLKLQITKDHATGQTRITGYDYTPIFTVAAEDGTVRVVRLKEAIAAYENRYIDRVSDKTYSDMVYALSRVEARVNAQAAQ